MKSTKITLLYLVFFFIGNAYSQTGINSKSPKATFDISAKNLTDTSTEGLLIPRISRLKAQNMQTVETSTLIYINSITDGTNTGKTVDVDQVGYYYYDGAKWVKLSIANLNVSNGITNTNGSIRLGGTLTQNTNIITTTNNKLAITGNFENNFSVGETAFSVDSDKKFVGIGTTTPTTNLDINGKVKIRNTDVLTGNNLSSLYVDENGVVGTSVVSMATPKTFYAKITSQTDVKTEFNEGTIISLPINTPNILLNTLDLTYTNNNIKINTTGIYQLTGSTNFSLSTGTKGQEVYVAINIQKSTNNGVNWSSILGSRPVFNMLSSGNYNYSTTLPTALVQLNQNDLIRMVIYRTKSGDRLQGEDATIFNVTTSSYGSLGYDMLISKL